MSHGSLQLVAGNATPQLADSIAQCHTRGEIHHALEQGEIVSEGIAELGQIISGASPGRTSDTQVSVADLTGVAVQDIAIATAVYKALS